MEKINGRIVRIKYYNKDNGYTVVTFTDNVEIEVPTRMLILNIIFWEPNVSFGLLPESSDFFNIKSITTDSISVIQSKLYKKALHRLTQVPYMQIVMRYLYNIDRLSNFIQRHMGIYMPSIDALGLARLMENPALKKLAEFEKELDERFFRLGRSWLINLKMVRRVTKTEVHLADGSIIPLPRGQYDAINRAIIAGD